MFDDILIIVPARGGSKGIPNKNLKLLNGVPLFMRTVIQAERCGFKNIFVSTDSEEIAALANKRGKYCPILRPANIAGDLSHMFHVFKHAIMYFNDVGERYRYFIALLPTMPFRPDASVIQGAHLLHEGAHWVFSCNEFEHHPYRAVEIVNGNVSSFFGLDDSVMFSNRQELPKMFRFNGGVIGGEINNIIVNDLTEYNISADGVICHAVYNTKEESVDIDDPIDFSFCEFISSQRS
jgi:CMP-N,N'-diacetyllegionaminic acid synthase